MQPFFSDWISGKVCNTWKKKRQKNIQLLSNVGNGKIAKLRCCFRIQFELYTFFFILKRTSHNCFSLFAYFFNWIIRSFRLLSISVYFYDFFPLFYTFRRYTVCFKARYYIFFGVSWYIIHARSRCKHSILRYEPGSWFGHSIEHLTYPFHSMTFKSNEQLASVTVTFTSPSTVLWNRTSERWKLGYWDFISVK